MVWRGVIAEFRDYLPIPMDFPPVTLLEGNTPLLRADRIAAKLGLKCQLYLKYEGANPTGSFKDRGMTVAVTKAVQEGARAVICASTGNTSASAAAYAARAGLQCVILIPEGAIAEGKLSQTLAHGAQVVAVKGNFDAALKIVRQIASKFPITLVNSLNPYRLEGQKTAAFEICDQLGGQAPDYLLLPVGNAGNITAYWQGFKEYYARGRSDKRPRMLGFQAKGADPIVRGRVVKKPHTIATAIRIGNPASWALALQARDESGGLITSVTDGQILAAYKLLAQEEGLFVEPASAASVAGLIKLARENFFPNGATLVCVLTGHGLKDPKTALAVTKRMATAKPTLDEVLKASGLHKVL